MVEMLNKLYVTFDDITDKYNVYKVVAAPLLLPAVRPSVCLSVYCLQCFDAVGLATGSASGL